MLDWLASPDIGTRVCSMARTEAFARLWCEPSCLGPRACAMLERGELIQAALATTTEKRSMAHAISRRADQ